VAERLITQQFGAACMNALCCIDLSTYSLLLVNNLLFGRSQWPAARSKTEVGGRLPAETVGSNPTGSMDVCLL
jgi:hypothetical protein